MATPTTEADWGQRATAHIKAKMKESGVTYKDMVSRLEPHGFKETEASFTMKLKRGAFGAGFLLACLAALNLDGVLLEEI